MGPQATSDSVMNAPAALIRTLQGHITYWSAAMEQRYGFAAEEAVGQEAHGLLQTRSWQALHEIEGTLEARHSWIGGLIHQRADATPVMAAHRWQLHRSGGDVFVTELHTDIVSPDTPQAGPLADVVATIAQELSQPLAALSAYIGGMQRASARPWPDRAYLEHGMSEAGKQLARAGELLNRVRALGESVRNPRLRTMHAQLTEAMQRTEHAIAQSVRARQETDRARIRRAAARTGAVTSEREAMLGNIRQPERVLRGTSSRIEPAIEQALRQLLDEERKGVAAIEQREVSGDRPFSDSPD